MKRNEREQYKYTPSPDVADGSTYVKQRYNDEFHNMQ